MRALGSAARRNGWEARRKETRLRGEPDAAAGQHGGAGGGAHCGEIWGRWPHVRAQAHTGEVVHHLTAELAAEHRVGVVRSFGVVEQGGHCCGAEYIYIILYYIHDTTQYLTITAISSSVRHNPRLVYKQEKIKSLRGPGTFL